MTSKKLSYILVAVACILASFASAEDGKLHGRIIDLDGKIPYSYRGFTGPNFWGSLSLEYAVCESGTHQSPVTIPAKDMKRDRLPPDFKLPSLQGYKIIKKKLTIEVYPLNQETDRSTGFVLNGHLLTLLQFHIHTPSEHKVGSKQYPAEIHFVFESDDGQLAVVGLFVEESKNENAAWAQLLRNMPSEIGSSNTVNQVLEMPDIAKAANDGVFAYGGSLTTPPCTEGVQFFMLNKPMTMSSAQITAVQDLIGFSARPIQANGNVPSSVEEDPDAGSRFLTH